MSTKLQPTKVHTGLLKIVGKAKPKSREALYALGLNNKDLLILQEIKWNELDITSTVLATMQTAKVYVPGALALRKKDIKINAGNFNLNQQARRNCHHVDISQLTGKETDFIETPWLDNRGNEGQVRQQNTEVIKLTQPEKLQSAVA